MIIPVSPIIFILYVLQFVSLQVVLSAIVTACYGAAVYNGDPKLANIIRSDVDIAPDGQYQYM